MKKLKWCIKNISFKSLIEEKENAAIEKCKPLDYTQVCNFERSRLPTQVSAGSFCHTCKGLPLQTGGSSAVKPTFFLGQVVIYQHSLASVKIILTIHIIYNYSFPPFKNPSSHYFTGILVTFKHSNNFLQLIYSFCLVLIKFATTILAFPEHFAHCA